MSHRANHDLADAQLDRALRTIVADDGGSVDLHARVMAAIERAPRSGSRQDRNLPHEALAYRILARPAAALAVVALLGIGGVAMWFAGERRPVRLAVDAGASRPAGRSQPVGSPSAASDPASASPVETHAPDREDAGARATFTRVALPRAAQTTEPWSAALPQLQPPEPIEVEPLEETPVRVAQLEVERLSIEPLEMDALNDSQEE